MTVPIKRLFEWVQNLPEGEVAMEVNDQFVLKASCGSSRLKLHGLDSKEFPTIPASGKGAELVLSYDVLKDALVRSSFAAASVSEPRVVLTGVLFEREKEKLRLVATNAHRLVIWEREHEGEGESFQIILPSRSAGEVVRALKKEEVQIFIDKNLVVFRQDDRSVFSRPLEGKFPPYEQVMPDAFSVEWKVSLEAFQQALKRVAVVAKEDAGGVKLVGGKSSVSIGAVTQDVGEAEEEIPVEEGSGSGEVAFNVDYVLDVIPHFRGSYVWIRLNSNDKPALLQGEEDGYRYIVMPMRLS